MCGEYLKTFPNYCGNVFIIKMFKHLKAFNSIKFIKKTA